MDSILIQDGQAHEIWRRRAKTTLKFHPNIMAQIVEQPDNTVQPKDTWDGSNFATPVPPAPTPREVRLAEFKSVTIRAELIAKLEAATPAEIDAWVDVQVTDLASARLMLKRILLMIAPER